MPIDDKDQQKEENIPNKKKQDREKQFDDDHDYNEQR